VNSPEKSPVPPQHVAIIMDGNGRWARSQGLARIAGHRKGVENIQIVAKAARDHGVRYLTLYAFSVENWKRPKDEINALMKLLETFLKKGVDDFFKNKIRLRVIGDISALPLLQRNLLKQALKKTAHLDDHHLVMALNYGSRSEVLNAAKAFAADVKKGKVDPQKTEWEDFSRYLNTADIPDPDLIIRTSGEHRLSNFLLMQAAYSEMYFSPVHWPEFDEKCFAQAIDDYHNRERRFGLTGEQLKQDNTARKK